MPLAWPIIKFLFQVVAPTLPEIVSTVSKMRNPDSETDMHEQNLERRIADLDRRLALQLDLIDTLTTQLTSLHLMLRRTLLLSISALILALITMAWLLLTR